MHSATSAIPASTSLTPPSLHTHAQAHGFEGPVRALLDGAASVGVDSAAGLMPSKKAEMIGARHALSCSIPKSRKEGVPKQKGEEERERERERERQE